MVHDAGQLHDGLFQQGGRGLPFGQTGQEDQGISFHAGGQGKVVVDDFDTALTILDQVLADNAADADALAMRGLACLLAGRRGDAEQAFAAIPQDCAAADMARAVMEVA